jgi:hypothetical protein
MSFDKMLRPKASAPRAPHQPLIDRLTDQLGGNREMALSILRDRGHVEQNSERLTAEGAYREALGPAGRAIDRATKISGRLARDYEYDAGTNRATLKKR